MLNKNYRSIVCKDLIISVFMKKYSLFCLVATSVFLLCSACTYGRNPRKSASNASREKSLTICVDDSVKKILGDSISHIVFEADTVKLFTLSVTPLSDSLLIDSIKTDSVVPPDFHGCYVKHNHGVLSKFEITPMLFVLSDRDNYLRDDIRLKSPFIPDVALSFKKGESVVDIVFSFTGGQLYVFTEREKELYVKYTYERLVIKFFNSFLKDERLTEFLKL